MNKLFFAFLVLFCLVHGQSFSQAPGDVIWSLLPDPSWSYDTIKSVKVQQDGKIVAAGDSYYNGTYLVIAVGRYDEGIPDSSFGVGGIVITALDSVHIMANDVEIQQDGKIVVAGGYRKGAAGDFLLMRYNEDGRIDSSFGINGIVRADILTDSFDVATALAIQTDGKIVAAGSSGSMLAVCRYNADGSPDTSFDVDGKLLVTAGGATCMKLQANGKIVICCGDAVIRLLPDGGLDYTFAGNGIAALAGTFRGMALQNDGKILVAGGDGQFIVERLDTAGIPDNGFGSRGIVTTRGINNPDHGQGATSVCVQRDGRILATGFVRYGILSNWSNFAIARYKSNGEVDSSFGSSYYSYGYRTGNKEIAINGFSTAVSFSAAITNNGEIVLAGTNSNERQLPSQWVLVGCYLGPMLGVPTVPGIKGQIVVVPNPVTDFAHIQSTHIENGSWHLSLSDLTGKTLHSETVVITNHAFDKSISLIGLPAAMYFVKLENGNSSMTVKLTKSR